MRNTRIIIIVLIIAGSLFGCDKNELRLTEFDLPTDKAYVKFALLSPGTPAVMIKVNDIKINGASTSGTAGFYPSTTNFEIDLNIHLEIKRI